MSRYVYRCRLCGEERMTRALQECLMASGGYCPTDYCTQQGNRMCVSLALVRDRRRGAELARLRRELVAARTLLSRTWHSHTSGFLKLDDRLRDDVRAAVEG